MTHSVAPLRGDLMALDEEVDAGTSSHLVVSLRDGIARRGTSNPAVAYLISLRSPRSRVTMTSFLNNVASKLNCSSLYTCPWEALNRQHVLAILEALQLDGLAPNTINTYLAAIKGTALEARSMRLMSSEDFLDIKNVRRVKGFRLPKGRALEPLEMKDLLATCSEDSRPIDVRDRAILNVLLGCGLRREEIVSLDYPKHVDWIEGKLVVLGKGNKERVAYLPRPVVDPLRAWIAGRGKDPGPLFVRILRHDKITRKRLSTQAIYNLVGERSIQAGIEKISPHDTRRTFATHHLNNGVDLLTLQRLMGHSSLETTKQYDRRGDAVMKEAAENLTLF